MTELSSDYVLMKQGTSETRATLMQAFESIIKATGEDPERDGLRKTSLRAAKAFEFFTTGYNLELKGKYNKQNVKHILLMSIS